VVAGFAKTAIGGLGTVAVALVAGVMPARESTAALLLLLLVGDVLAVSLYRRDCDWSLLRHLVPAVLPGLVLGSVVLALVDDTTMRIGLGVVLLLLVLAQLATGPVNEPDPGPFSARLLGRFFQRVPGRVSGRVAERVSGRVLAQGASPIPRVRAGWSWQAATATGMAAGFTTMVANAAGPVMTLYLVAQGVDKRRFLGTAAWFFLGVNLCKLPFSVGLGLVDRSMLRDTAVLAPLVWVGGLTGLLVVRRIGQRSFETAVLAASALSALLLLIR
jgi:uncharacterized membrane protein YfcA